MYVQLLLQKRDFQRQEKSPLAEWFFFFFLLWKIISVAEGTNSVIIDHLEDYDPTKGPFSVAKIYVFIVNYITLIFKC